MDSEHDSVVGVYSEAKSEYSRQLSLFLLPVLTKFFFGLLDLTKEEETEPKKHIWAFQNKLSQIPEWNQDKVIRETGKIHADTGCDYLEELLTAVFIAHTKVLSSIRLNNRQKKLQISIPKVDHFLHRTLSECSRILWSSAYLFHENISSIEKQKNLEKIKSLVDESIMQAVRSMLPVKNILREYLSEEPDAPVSSSEAAEVAEVAEAAEVPLPVLEPSVEPVLKPAVEQVVKPVVAPVLKPAVEPVLKPSVAPVVELVAEPVVEPVAKPVPAPTEPSPSISTTKEIVVSDTEPSVRFADFNTVFNDNGNTLEKMVDEDDGLIKFDDIEAPVPLTDFEDLEKPKEDEDDDVIPIDDYEVL